MPLPTTANVARPKSLGYGARLDDLYLRLAIGPDRGLKVETAPLQAPRINTAENAEDLSNEFGQLFSRARFDGGEGLDFAHRRDLADVDATRFWDSQNIDVVRTSPGAPQTISLLHSVDTIKASANTNLALAYDGTAIYMADGTTIQRSANPLASTPTFATDDPHAAEGAVTVNDLTVVGDIVYAALGANGIHKRSGGVWSHLSGTAAVKVWGAKGYLFAATAAGVLSTINLATGAILSTLVTLPSGQTWLDLCDAGAAVLVSATNGIIYSIVETAAGTLTLKAQTQIDAPEVPYALGNGPGGAFVMYGTREATTGGAIGRWWRAALDLTTFVLTDATLVRQWETIGSTCDAAPRRIFTNRDSVYAGICEPTRSHLWRYDASTGGRVRHLDAKASALVIDGLAISGLIFFTTSGVGLNRESSSLVESTGYLMGPLADFFTSESKSWAGAILDHETVAAGRIELYYTTDSAALSDSTSSSWIRVKDISSGNDSSETPLVSVDARYLAGMVKLYANTAATAGPAVRAFAFRAYPGPGDVVVSMWVNVSDVVKRPHGRRVTAKGLGAEIYETLKSREGRYAELELLQPADLLRGVVEQVGTPIPALPTRGSSTYVCQIQFRGRRSSRSLSESTGALGVGEMGVMFMGGKELT